MEKIPQGTLLKITAYCRYPFRYLLLIFMVCERVMFVDDWVIDINIYWLLTAWNLDLVYTRFCDVVRRKFIAKRSMSCSEPLSSWKTRTWTYSVNCLNVRWKTWTFPGLWCLCLSILVNLAAVLMCILYGMDSAAKKNLHPDALRYNTVFSLVYCSDSLYKASLLVWLCCCFCCFWLLFA